MSILLTILYWCAGYLGIGIFLIPLFVTICKERGYTVTKWQVFLMPILWILLWFLVFSEVLINWLRSKFPGESWKYDWPPSSDIGRGKNDESI